jgi:hypothetical protein
MAGGSRRLECSRLTLGAVMLVRWLVCEAVKYFKLNLWEEKNEQ